MLKENRPPGMNFDDVLYADDAIIFSTDEHSLEALLHKIEEVAEPYGLKLNNSKCETLCTDPVKKFKIKTKSQHKVKKRTEAKYLGCKLNYESNIRKELGKRKAACSYTWKKLENFWKHSNTSNRTKLIAYNAVINSKLLYGLETANLTKGLRDSLDAFQLKGLGQLLKLETTWAQKKTGKAKMNSNNMVYKIASKTLHPKPDTWDYWMYFWHYTTLLPEE